MEDDAHPAASASDTSEPESIDVAATFEESKYRPLSAIAEFLGWLVPTLCA